MTAPAARSAAQGVSAQASSVNGSARLPASALATALPTRQRHNGFIALAVALIVGLAAIGAYLYSTAGSKTPVVMVVNRIPVGQVVQRSDLTTVPVSGRVVAIAGSKPGAATIPLTFAPAEAIQVDFGAGPMLADADGVIRRTWAFVMTL